MEYVIINLNKLALLLYPWINEVSIAIVASVIIMFATDINRLLRRVMSGSGFIARTAVFVLVNAFGYGLAIVMLSPLLTKQLKALPGYWMLLIVVFIFMVIGAWAQRNRQV